MIGLKRHTVKLISYQKEWMNEFKRTEIKLHELLQEEIQLIEHVGSTAIIGLAAKPIIDIAVAIESYDKLKKIRPILIQNNYEDRGENKGGYLFVKRVEDLTTHHIHFVPSLSQKWRDYLFFKNKLNSDEKLLRAYSALKLKLASKYAKNRGAYTNAKNDFIQKVLMNQ